ncbi:polyribonucleotide nucleotidyltransferase 1, mitochondrial-like [Portunus trituberculatus]|uniref:polyribonucleotide nucleotidyltransferase n=1 Tax=Portunus trituberculatus TaxID=210409 RepID=A0A5B7DLC9_PORTR|nr:polyribonucleotide nucleotidyltransferase 1, mitochondrial-like [Portunus trituberculatus]MPC21985.1 Polyribonucleotide nucleotidyltransferase 1, mitochondrial [Portunus trituberculatus]
MTVLRRLCRSWSIFRTLHTRRGLSTSAFLCDKVDVKAEFSNGRTLCLESGGYARMADGAAVATLGNTSVLITAVSKPRPGPSPGFMPLTVDYRQKYAAAGRIPSNYLRREMAPTDKEILTGRVIDRSVRPLFPEGFHGDTQLSCQLMAVDGLYDPDVVSINAASAALAVSDIPWEGPVGAVRVGLIDGEVIVQPTRRELSKSSLNLIVTAADHKLIVMLEGGGDNVLQQDLMKAIKAGVKECQHVVRAIQQLARDTGKPKRPFTNLTTIPQEVLQAVSMLSETRLRGIFTDFSHDKVSRDEAVNALRQDVTQKVMEEGGSADPHTTHLAFSQVTRRVFRELLLDEETRCDGRTLDELRPISCNVDLFRPLHGSSLFQRGQTQVQCTVAFDAPENMPKLDPLLEATGGHRDRNFILHYTFPSFATNEVSRGGPVSRREVGHGALAEKALRPLLPPSFPFAILLTSTVLESNGSSSMASVCGGSLALMDAGVNLSAPAAGVAIGLVTRYDETGNLADYKLMTDILGIEDYMGDMDFKLAGTSKGITALQADMKVAGIPLKVAMEAVQKSTEAKGTILAIMGDTLSRPRPEKDTMPVLEKVDVPAHKRSRVMGPGGIHMRRIQAETGVQLSWEGDNVLSVFAPNPAAMEEARENLQELLSDHEPNLEFGGVYTASVVELRPQGVMVTLYSTMNPVLLHNSQLDTRKVHHPSALGLEVGQEIKVKYFGRDPASGQMRLSRRALQASNLAFKNLHRTEPV